MSVRVRSQVVIVASLDTEEKQGQFERQDKALTSVVETFDVENSGDAILSASEANYAIPMGKISVGALIYLESNKALTVKLNGAAVGLPMTPTVGMKAKLLLRGTFSAAPIITNATTDEAQVSFFLAGAK